MPESQSSMIPKQHGSYHSSTGFLNFQFFSESSQNSFPSECVYDSRVRLVILFDLGVFWLHTWSWSLLGILESSSVYQQLKAPLNTWGTPTKIFDTVSMQLLSYIICGYAILNT